MTFLVPACGHGVRWTKLEEGRASLAPPCSLSQLDRSLKSLHAAGPPQHGQQAQGQGKGFAQVNSSKDSEGPSAGMSCSSGEATAAQCLKGWGSRWEGEWGGQMGEKGGEVGAVGEGSGEAEMGEEEVGEGRWGREGGGSGRGGGGRRGRGGEMGERGAVGEGRWGRGGKEQWGRGGGRGKLEGGGRGSSHCWPGATLTALESESVSRSVVSDCDPMGCSPPGSSVRGILQASTLEWAAISSSRGPSLVSRTAGQFFTTRATLDFSPSEMGAAQRLCGAQRSWDSEGRPASQGARARGGQSASLSCRQSEEGKAGRTGGQEGSTV